MEILHIGSLATSIAVGYVLGSAPVAYLVARFKGVDIFEVGTRNPGAANVFRVVSRSLGALVLVLDALKGLLAVVIADIFGVIPGATAAAGAAAVVGHWNPVFMRFKGGAGLATAVGAGIGLAPFPGLIALLLALLTLLIIRNTGYAAAVGYVGFVSLSLILDTAWTATLGTALLAAMVALRSMAIYVLQHRRDRG